jgi:hypothetical protein
VRQVGIPHDGDGCAGGAAFISIAKAYIASTKAFGALEKTRCMLFLEKKDQKDLLGCSISTRCATLQPDRSGSCSPLTTVSTVHHFKYHSPFIFFPPSMPFGQVLAMRPAHAVAALLNESGPEDAHRGPYQKA